MNKLLFAFLFTFVPFLLTAQKTDTIVVKNKNIITGEIKKLSYGLMTFKTSGMGTLKVKREYILGIKSKKKFEIVTNDGDVYFGSFDLTNSENPTVKINFINGYNTFDLNKIVEIYPIHSTFWKRISGNFDAGFNFSKGSDIANVSFSGNLTQNSRLFSNSLSTNSSLVYTGDSIKSTKSDFSINSEKKLKNGWSIGGVVGMNSNSELGLDMRLLISMVAVYDFFYTDKNRFFLSAGPLGNLEWDKGNSKPSANYEGYLNLEYRYYKYSSPEIQITTSLAAFPNLTFNGRWRFSYQLDARVEVVNNFYIGSRLYADYDNQPAAEAISKTDWGLNLTVGYSFN